MLKRMKALFFALLLLAAALPVLATAQDALSDDLYSFEAMIDGVHYQFPCTYEDLTANGWVLSDDPTTTLSPDQYTFIYFEKEGFADMRVCVYNCYSNTREVIKCYMAGFELQIRSYDKEPAVSCEMPGGIKLNESTLDDVIAAYGEPSRRYDGDTRWSLTYSYDTYRSIEFSSSDEGKIVDSIDLENLIEPEGFVDEVGDTSAVPAVVGLYTAPTELGENPLSHVIEIDGALYQLPVPVSALIENGFAIMPDKTDAVAKGADSAWVTLIKNNQQMRTLAYNYSENATNIENCFIVDVSVGESGCNLPSTLPLGITIGMSQEDLLAILSDMEYLTDEGSSYIVYQLADNERARNAISIYVNKETGNVYKFEVENDIRRADIEAYLASAPALVTAPKPVLAEPVIASPLATADQLSSDLSAFELLVNGRLYKFPMTYAELVGDAWVPEVSGDVTLGSDKYESYYFKFGSPMAKKTTISAYFYNLTGEEAKLADLPIGGLSISLSDDARDPRTEFVLTGGFQLGTATMDEIRAAYGEPSYESERALEYSFGSYQMVRLSFDDGILTGIGMRNFV